MWLLAGSRKIDGRRHGIQRGILGLFWLVVASIPALAQHTDIGWPRTVQSNRETIEIYQPQVDKWEGGKIEARAAMVVTERNAASGIYGVVEFSARTTLDQSNRLVTLYDIEVAKASFPSARGEETAYIGHATEALAQWNLTIALDRLLSDLAIVQSEAKASDGLSMAPPKIYVRENPAVLILIDGEPVLQKVNGTNLMRVVNSPAMILLETDTSKYFLQGDGYWMVSSDLSGLWNRAVNPPKALSVVVEEEAQAGAQENTKIATTSSATVPEVIVSTQPAELIQLTGQAQFSPIRGTQLLYVTNTDNDLFMSVPQQRYYALLSGRWFSAQTLEGPWEFVPGAALPPDFARIPAEHPKAAVLASIPGTPQAKDAIVAAQVPQTATVDRKTAKFTATYDGEPQFKPIEGTDMSYAANSPDDIILVGGKYYAVNDGVWFVSDNPLGPWVVCDSVPAEMYSIPPTSPVYPVRYVYVYDSTPDFVYVGYTPGYFGAFVWNGVIVYGTGYWYPCWCTNFWCGWPWTWGFGWHYLYGGGGFFWRPWHPNRWYWRPWPVAHGAPVLWGRRTLYNRSLQRTPSQVVLHHASVYDRWQAPAVVGRRPVSLRPPGTLGQHPLIPPQKPVPGRPDMYAGRDGQVYLHRNDGWYRRNGEKWEPVQPRPAQPKAKPGTPAPRPTPTRPNSTIEELNRQRQARIQGANRANQFRTAKPPAAARPPAPARPPGRRGHI